MKHGLWICVLMMLCAACARIEPLPGGPSDKQPPNVVEAYPPSGSTDLPPDLKFRIRFDEWVDRSRTQADVYLSPWFEPGLEKSWFGHELRIQPREPLPLNRTWLLEIGTGCRDLAGNPLHEPFRILFSTGGELHEGSLHGSVCGAAKTSDVQVWAWPAQEHPVRFFERAPWRTRLDADGNFRLDALPEGEYFLLAVEDKNPDGRWNFLWEPAALPQRKCNTAEELPLRFHLSTELALDSLKLQRVIAPDPWHLLLNGILEPDLQRGTRSIDPGLANRLRLRQLKLYHKNWQPATLLSLAPLGEYWLLWTSLQDSSGGYLLAPAWGDTLEVSPALADTVFTPFAEDPPTRVSPDGLLDWNPRRAVQIDSSRQAWLFRGEDSLSVLPEWLGGLHLRWQLGDSLRSANLQIPAGYLKLSDGTSWPDSLLSLPLQQTAESAPGQTGDVQLLIPGLDEKRRNHGWTLISWQSGEEVRRDPLIDAQLLLEDVPAGKLTFSMFQDRNRDAIWNPGRVEPFLAAESWIQLPDTVEVIAGWRQEEQKISSPEEWR